MCKSLKIYKTNSWVTKRESLLQKYTKTVIMAIIAEKNDKIHCLTVCYPLYIQWKSQMGDKTRTLLQK